MPPIVALLLSVALVSAPADETTCHQRYDQLQADFAEQLKPIADAAELASVEPLRLGERFYVAADNYYAVDTPLSAVAEPVAKLRTQFASLLADLAAESAKEGEAALSARVAHHALHLDTNQSKARKLLGYVQDGDIWLTPYAATMKRRGRVWDAQYGWIEPGDRARYETGEREVAGRWLSREQDAARHDDIAQGWQIRTDHFVVTTNHSLKAGAALAASLERLHAVWWQLFADLVVTDSELRRAAISGRGFPLPRRPMQVAYHRDRNQYNARLRARQPKIDMTLGIYFDRYREAHFFADADADANNDTESATTPTLYHEAAHQLFQESFDGIRGPGSEANFWAIEAAALYFESLTAERETENGTIFTLGTVGSGRLPAAAHRWTESGYRVPLAELVSLGQHQLQSREDIAPLYSQIAGMGHFFLAKGVPERREAFAQYLKLIYEGRDKQDSLAIESQTSLPVLDKQYGEWIEGLPVATPE